VRDLDRAAQQFDSMALLPALIGHQDGAFVQPDFILVFDSQDFPSQG